VCDSQEAWWLRKGCHRSRCRLIKKLADAFEIPLRSVQVRRVHLVFRTNVCARRIDGEQNSCPRHPNKVHCSPWSTEFGVVRKGSNRSEWLYVEKCMSATDAVNIRESISECLIYDHVSVD
jgi:hypothetical protein